MFFHLIGCNTNIRYSRYYCKLYIKLWIFVVNIKYMEKFLNDKLGLSKEPTPVADVEQPVETPAEPTVEPVVEETIETPAEPVQGKEPEQVTEEVEEDMIVTTIGEEIELPNGDDTLLEQLKAKGIEVNSLEDLKPTKPLTEEVVAIQKFIEATGKPAKEYFKIFKDVDSMDEDKLIRDYHKEIGTTPKMLDLKMDEMSLVEVDEDFEDADAAKHNKRAEALREAEVLKAKGYFKELQEKFALPPEPTEEELLKQRANQILAKKEMADRVASNLPPTEFSVDKKKFKMVHGKKSQEFVKDFIKNPEDHFVKPYVDEQGNFKSEKAEVEYYENALWFNKESREMMQKVRDKQIWDAAIESQSKDKRNVTLDTKTSVAKSKQGSPIDKWNEIKSKR